MADDDFHEVKRLTKGKIDALEIKLNNLSAVGTEIKDLVASTLKKVANIDRRYENGNIEEKRTIISSMFPELDQVKFLWDLKILFFCRKNNRQF